MAGEVLERDDVAAPLAVSVEQRRDGEAEAALLAGRDRVLGLERSSARCARAGRRELGEVPARIGSPKTAAAPARRIRSAARLRKVMRPTRSVVRMPLAIERTMLSCSARGRGSRARARSAARAWRAAARRGSSASAAVRKMALTWAKQDEGQPRQAGIADWRERRAGRRQPAGVEPERRPTSSPRLGERRGDDRARAGRAAPPR